MLRAKSEHCQNRKTAPRRSQPHWACQPTRSHRQEELPSRQATRTRQEATTSRVGTGEAFLRGTASHAKYIGCADRLGERELALCRCAISDRFFLDTDLHIGFPRRCAVGPVVCGRLRILDLLSARPAVADIGHRPENASSGRFSRSAAQFAIGRTALRRRARADSPGGDPDLESHESALR
jgi:hypothetical protein